MSTSAPTGMPQAFVRFGAGSGEGVHTTLTGFRYRLALTDEQAGQHQVCGDICRAVWNTGLDQRREAVARWQRGRHLPCCGYHLQARELAKTRR